MKTQFKRIGLVAGLAVVAGVVFLTGQLSAPSRASGQAAQGPTITIFRADGQVVSGPLVRLTGTGFVIGTQEVKFTDTMLMLVSQDIRTLTPGLFFGAPRTTTMMVENKGEATKEAFSSSPPVFMNLTATWSSGSCGGWPVRIAIEFGGQTVASSDLSSIGKSFSFTGLATKVTQGCWPGYWLSGYTFAVSYTITTYGQ